MSSGEVRILLTGCNGLVGSGIMHGMIRRGENIHGLFHNHRQRIDYYGWKADICSPCDLTDRSALKAVIEPYRPTVIIHCAEPYSHPQADGNNSAAMRSVAVMYNILTTAAESGVQQFLHMSSSMVYDHSSVISEKSNLSPISAKGKVKRMEELLCELFADRFRRLAYLRLFRMYAVHDQSDRLLSSLLSQSTSDEIITISSAPTYRSYVHVDDLVELLSQMLSSDKPWNICYNVASPQVHTAYDVSQLISTLMSDSEFCISYDSQFTTPADREYFRVDNTLVERDFGWRPSISLADGLTRLAQAYKKAPW